MKTLALFDFDGTITDKDSFLEFIRFYKGLPGMVLGLILLSPILLLYKIHLIHNWKAKEIVFTFFFRNEYYNVFKKKCRNFSDFIIPGIIKPNALETIGKHILNGHKVIVISASFEEYLTDWCEKLRIDCIGTRIDVRNNRLTGKIRGKNCYGKEKVSRLKQYIDIEQYDEVLVYGNSKGDWALMEIADQKFYKFF
jgi:phosphatidylglycerophosphatase C